MYEVDGTDDLPHPLLTTTKCPPTQDVRFGRCTTAVRKTVRHLDFPYKNCVTSRPKFGFEHLDTKIDPPRAWRVYRRGQVGEDG